MLAVSSCSMRKGLWGTAPPEPASATLTWAPSAVVYFPSLDLISVAGTLAIIALTCDTNRSMRSSAVCSALRATVSLPWQPLATHPLNAFCAWVQSVLPVGLPLASTQGVASNRWPVTWKLKLPVAGSFTVQRVTWHPAHNLEFALLPCVAMTVSPDVAVMSGGNQPAYPSSVSPSGECGLLR